jgi:hypothetical protein
VGKGKRADVYLEVRKRRGAYIFLMKQVPVVAPCVLIIRYHRLKEYSQS